MPNIILWGVVMRRCYDALGVVAHVEQHAQEREVEAAERKRIKTCQSISTRLSDLPLKHILSVLRLLSEKHPLALADHQIDLENPSTRKDKPALLQVLVSADMEILAAIRTCTVAHAQTTVDALPKDSSTWEKKDMSNLPPDAMSMIPKEAWLGVRWTELGALTGSSTSDFWQLLLSGDSDKRREPHTKAGRLIDIWEILNPGQPREALPAALAADLAAGAAGLAAAAAAGELPAGTRYGIRCI